MTNVSNNESLDSAIATVSQECAALRTRMAARSITRAYDDALRPIGLRITQFTILAAIHRGAPDSVSSLAEALAMERTTLTRNLRLLVEAGYVELGAEGYRRARAMRLTEAGRSKLQEAIPLWRSVQQRVTASFGNERWRDARDLLTELAHSV